MHRRIAVFVRRAGWSPVWLTAFLGAVSIIGWAAARMQLAIPAWMVVLGTVVLGSGLAIGGLSRLRLRRLQAKHARFLAEGLADLNRLGRLENQFFLAVSWVLAGSLLCIAGMVSLVFSGLPVSALPAALGLAAGTLLMAGALIQTSEVRSAVLALIAPRSGKAIDSHEALRRLTPRFHADSANRMAFAGGEATEDARKLAAIADHPGAFWPRIDVLPGHSVRSRLAALAAGVAGLWRKVAVAGVLAWVLAALVPFPALPPLPSPLAVWEGLTTPPEPEDAGTDTETPTPDAAPADEETGSDPLQGEAGSDAQGTGGDPDGDQGAGEAPGETGEESGDGPSDAPGGSGQDGGAEGSAEGEGAAQTGEGQGGPPEGSGETEAGSGEDQGEGEGPSDASGSTGGSGQGDGAAPVDPGGDEAEGEGVEQPGEGQGRASAESGEMEAGPDDGSGEGDASGQSEEGSEGDPGDAAPSATDAGTDEGPSEAPGSTGGSGEGDGATSTDQGGDEAEGRAPGQGAEGEGVEQPGEGQGEAPGGPAADSGAENAGPASSGDAPGQAGDAAEQDAGSGTGGQGETPEGAGGATDTAGATGAQEPADASSSGTANRAEATESGAEGERVEAAVPGDVGADPVDERPGLEALVRPDAPSAASETIDMTLQATGWAGETDTPAETRPDVQGFAAPGGMAQTLVATPPSADLPDTGTPTTLQSPEQPVPTWIRGLFGP